MAKKDSTQSELIQFEGGFVIEFIMTGMRDFSPLESKMFKIKIELTGRTGLRNRLIAGFSF